LREDGCAFRDGVYFEGEFEGSEVFQEGGIEKRFIVVASEVGEVAEVGFGEMEIADVFDDVGKAGRDGEAAFEGLLAEEDVEDRVLVGFAGFPIAVGHGELIEVGEQSVGCWAKCRQIVHELVLIKHYVNCKRKIVLQKVRNQRNPCADRVAFANIANGMAMAAKYDSLYATRASLLNRVKNPEDQESWKEFFDRYSRLIYSVAARAGLGHAEAEEVVQETFITLVRTMPNFNYDATKSFKSWLLKVTGRKVLDQFRKRKRRHNINEPSSARDGRTAAIERIPDPNSLKVESIFEDEWRQRILELALEKVKAKVNASQFQIYDLYVIKKWPSAKVASTLGIRKDRVFLAKFRVGQLVKREVKALQGDNI
jgi:RNA polymerase sigma factor (sigma-70 family)